MWCGCGVCAEWAELGEEEPAEHVELRRRGVGRGGHPQEADGASLGGRRVEGEGVAS
jgi:hypothetical protein